MRVIGTRIDKVDYISASNQAALWAKGTLPEAYICAANVHMLMEAYDSSYFGGVVDNASLVTPDGVPLVWMMRLKGARDQQRVYGPTLMLHLLEIAATEAIAVGFYGGTPDVLKRLVDRMQARYVGLIVKFAWSPPFSDMSPQEDVEVINQINQSGVRILFVGLGCPKQEIWMANHKGRVHAVMLGVGAAFDFHAGVKKQAPAWMQKIGLEWLFRLFSEPGRLWKRYLYNNPRFVVLAAADLLGLLR